jgi:hypothetical protein
VQHIRQGVAVVLITGPANPPLPRGGIEGSAEAPTVSDVDAAAPACGDHPARSTHRTLRGWDGADLSQQAECVPVYPLLDELAVDDAAEQLSVDV